MKKTLALLLALVLMVATAPAAFATSETSNSTKLTTTVPEAKYTLTIPTDTVIPYNATDTSLGYVTVTDASGFAVGKNLQVTLEYSAFTAENVDTTIPYTIKYSVAHNIGDTEKASSHTEDVYMSPMIFRGKADGTVNRLASITGGYVGELGVRILSSDWGKALAGNYTSTITFTASVVADK